MRTGARFRFALWVGGALLVTMLAAAVHAPDILRSADRNEVERSAAQSPAVPPWRHGRPEARFLLVSHGDFECPHCKGYFPRLRRWVDAHPEVQWEWRHLPLPEHEPAASRLVQLAECAGASGGAQAFFDAVDWIYEHTRTLGQGLPEGLDYPKATADVRRCVESGQMHAVLRAHAASAARDGIVATPTLQLIDRTSGRTLRLHGPVLGDALLSALDLLVVARDVERELTPLPAADPGGRPR